MDSNQPIFDTEDIQLPAYFNLEKEQAQSSESAQPEQSDPVHAQPNDQEEAQPGKTMQAQSGGPAQEKSTEQTSAPAVKYKRLSEIMEPLPPNECHLILSNFNAALLSGEIRAVRLVDDKSKKVVFKKKMIGSDGRQRVKSISDEILEDTPALSLWLDEQRKAARSEILVHKGVIGITEQAVTSASGAHDFQTLLQVRLARLQLPPKPTTQVGPTTPAETSQKRRQKKSALDSATPDCDMPEP